MIVLWSLTIAIAIGAGAWIHLDARQQAQIEAVNNEVREAVAGAEGWLDQGSGKDGVNVEHRLMTAIAAKDVSETVNARAVLAKVRTRLAELTADSLFDAAKTKLDAKAIVEAAALLRRYISEAHATKKAEAEQLFADCNLATSDTEALQTLMAMSDEQFVTFRNTGNLADRKLSHPKLAEIRATTLRRNLEGAKQRREEGKLAEAGRQKSERVAVEGAHRGADDKQAVAGVWRHQAGVGAPGEITLLPNGKVNNPEGQDTWTFSAKTLVLRWASPQAPGGFWVDTCTVSDDGATYRGVNQQNTSIAGWKVVKDPVDPTIAAKKQAAIAAEIEGAELFSGRSSEFIWKRIVGSWWWGGEGHSITFSQDGTFVEKGPSRGDGTAAEISRGLFRVGREGTIRISHENHFSAEVRMLTKHKLSIVVTDPQGKSWPMEGSWRAFGPLFVDGAEHLYANELMRALVESRSADTRRQAAENLKILGPLGRDPVPELLKIASNDGDPLRQQNAIEALGETGAGSQAVPVIAQALVRAKLPASPQPARGGARELPKQRFGRQLPEVRPQPRAPEFSKVAEESLIKLLPTIGKRLTMDVAVALLQVQKSGSERVTPAFESALAAGGITKDAVVSESNQRDLKIERGNAAKAAIDALPSIAAIGQKLLEPGIDAEIARAAEDALLKRLPSEGGTLTPNTAFVLFDVYLSGNKRLLPVIERAWAASGFGAYFAAALEYEREHPGADAAAVKQSAENPRGKGMRHVRHISEDWQRFMMTPDAPRPNFVLSRSNGPTLDELNEADRKRRAKWDEDRARMNQNRPQ